MHSFQYLYAHLTRFILQNAGDIIILADMARELKKQIIYTAH